MRYFRRLIWYFASRLLILTLASGLMLMAFYLAMNASNMYVILKNGMSKRAQTVMMGTPEDGLQDYFTAACLDADPMLKTARDGTSAYQLYYTVSGFDHRISLRSVWCWPWDVTATATLEERIPAIDGRLNTAGREWQNALGLSTSPPKWATANYRAMLVQQNGHWKIGSLTLLGTRNE